LTGFDEEEIKQRYTERNRNSSNPEPPSAEERRQTLEIQKKSLHWQRVDAITMEIITGIIAIATVIGILISLGIL